MAIDQATGALKSYLLHISTSKRYNAFKNRLWRWFAHVPPLLTLCQPRGKCGQARPVAEEQSLREFQLSLFRAGGRSRRARRWSRTLRALREIEGPKLLHVMTVKGKGYPAGRARPARLARPGAVQSRDGRADFGSGRRPRPLSGRVRARRCVDLARPRRARGGRSRPRCRRAVR